MATELAEKKTTHEWKDAFEGKLGHLATTSLAENLSILYPRDEKREPGQEAIDNYLRNIAEECKQRRKCVGDESLIEEDFLNRVRDDAVRLWKSNSVHLPVLKTAAAQKSSPFSLLFGGGSSLSSFMSWERLLEESDGNTEKKIQMLLNLEHLQDILLDWEDHVAAFFLEGLRKEVSASSRDFYELHKRWFSKSRSSNEFRTMQIGLCQNLVTVVNEQLALGEELSVETNSKIRDFVELALLMFEDWMMRGLYVHDKRVQRIGECFWTWLEMNGESTMSVAGQCVVDVDPDATWFTSWNAHLSPDQCLAIVSSDQTLSNAISRCSIYVTTIDSRIPSDSADHRMFSFWIWILHSILESTRASRFPWDSVVEAQNMEQQQMIVIQLFLAAMKIDNSDSPDHHTSFAMYGDAIETILLAEKGDAGLLRKSIASFLQKIKSDKNISADRKPFINGALLKILR